MLSFKSCLRKGVALAVAVPFGLISLAVSAQTNPNSRTLPNGADLSVQIDDPLQDMELKVPAAAGPGGTIDVPVTGTASVGEGEPDIHITFVMDVSGSTSNPNIPCLGGFVLACEQQAVVNAINDPNFSSVLDVGLTVFATNGRSADMTPPFGGTDDPLTSNFADAIIVANSTFSVFGGDGGVGQFTNKIAGVGTDYTTGLVSANNSVSASGAGTKRVFFLSDGTGASSLAAFDAAVDALGAQIDSFAIGTNAVCGSAFTASLQRMANRSGGLCAELTDPADIVTALPNLIATSLDNVQVAVDGSDLPTNTNPPVPADGPVTTLYDAMANLGVGDFNVTATATGSDSSPMGSMLPIVADVDIHLLQLAAAPASASNELGVDQTHAVNGAILGGTGPDRNIDFLVGGQNAATATPGSGASLATPGGAPVGFSYSVPAACDSLGQDTITVSTSIGGMTDSIVLTKGWVDTTSPDVTASLVCIGDDDDDDDSHGVGSCDDDDARLRIEFSSTDLVDADPGITAVLEIPGLADIPVTNGQIIEFEFDDDAEVEFDDGILEIEGPALTLRATATDCAGNVAEATAVLANNDDDDDDDGGDD